MSPKSLHIISRVLIASVFVGLGAERILAKFGILFTPRIAGVGGVVFSAFEMLAGIAIMLGWQASRFALLMAVFLAVDAFVAHPFWSVSAEEQHGQYLHFLKNFSAIGGLLLLAVVEGAKGQDPADGV
jgi:putative oxidoreductase